MSIQGLRRGTYKNDGHDILDFLQFLRRLLQKDVTKGRYKTDGFGSPWYRSRAISTDSTHKHVTIHSPLKTKLSPCEGTIEAPGHAGRTTSGDG